MTVAGSVGCVADQTGRARRAAASDDLRDPVILLLLLAVQWISVGRDCSAWAGIVHPGLSSSALPPATEPFGKREKVAAPGGGRKPEHAISFSDVHHGHSRGKGPGLGGPLLAVDFVGCAWSPDNGAWKTGVRCGSWIMTDPTDGRRMMAS